MDEFVSLALAAACPDKDVLESLRSAIVRPKINKLQLDANRTLLDLVSCHREANSGFYDSFAEAGEVRAHAHSLLRRLETVGLDFGGSTEGTGPVTAAPSPEQANGQPSASSSSAQQANNSHRHVGDTKPKGQHAAAHRNDDDKKTKDRSLKSREDVAAFVLKKATLALGNGYPLINNPLFLEIVVPAVARQISQLFEPGSEFGGKGTPKRGERTFPKTVHDSNPSDPRGRAVASVIEQVEMHYEVGSPSGQPTASSVITSGTRLP